MPDFELDQEDIDNLREILETMDYQTLPIVTQTSIGRVKLFPDGRIWHTVYQVWLSTSLED